MEISFSKIIQFLILAIVIIVIISTQFSNTKDSVISGVDKIKLKQLEFECNSANVGNNCDIKNCDILENNCTKEEEKLWAYLKQDAEKKCDESNEKISTECQSLQKKVIDLIENKDINNGYELGEYLENDRIDITQLNNIISNQKITLETFAKENDIDVNKLKVILIVESRGKSLDSENHPTIRFECNKFNDYLGSLKVKCTIEEGKSFSVIKDETDKGAFFRALEIDREKAILSSSFGIAQIMGFNYKIVGYTSVDEFYNAMFKEEEQISAFLKFLKSKNNIMRELKSENTDWKIIARNYNGPNYAENKYDLKLRQEYLKYS